MTACASENVIAFKVYCPEESLIAEVLRCRLAHHFEPPILDVGSGTGRISSLAFPGRKVIHIDVLDYSEHPLPAGHERHVADFFDFRPPVPVKTLLLAHVLQYIDDDEARLNERIAELAPDKVAVVTNRNDREMGRIVDWVRGNLAAANPELHLTGVPPHPYRLLERSGFTARLECPDFRTLTAQVLYLVDAEAGPRSRADLDGYLRQLLPAPSFDINQRIEIHGR